MGIKHYKVQYPSAKYYMPFWDMAICSDALQWLHVSLNRDIVTKTDLITVFDFTKIPGDFQRKFATIEAS